MTVNIQELKDRLADRPTVTLFECEAVALIDELDVLRRDAARIKKERDEAQHLVGEMHDTFARMMRERDAAQADATALREAILAYTTSATADDRTRLRCEAYDLAVAPHPGAPLLERLAALLAAARAYRDDWAGCSFAMGPLAIGVRWERLEQAIAALDEEQKEGI